MRWTRASLGAAAAVASVATHDLLQRRHSILRNFPVVGHARFWLERVGPERRQYIVAGNDEERPFSRGERRWVYASAKLENNYFGFGWPTRPGYRSGSSRRWATCRSGRELARQMADTGRAVDFVNVDCGEGGTDAVAR